MDRQGRGRPPHRQSSLPSSLHRFMVPGPSQSRRSTTHEGESRASPDRGEDPWRPAPSVPAHPIPSAPPELLPPTILTQAVFDEATVSGESAGSQRISPAPGTVSRDLGPAPSPALTVPPPPPPRGVLRSDPAYYASMPTYPATYSIPPPGPPLPPISWPPPRASGESPQVATADRGEVPPQFFPQPPPRPASHSPASPVAGPSRTREEPQRRRRRAQPHQSRATAPPQEAAFPPGTTPESRLRHGSGDTTRAESGSTPRAPSAGFPAEGSEPIQQASRPAPIPPSERGSSPRRVPQGARGSPSSSLTDNFPVAVGSTAYHVSTLLPLRATVLSPANEPGPTAAAASPASAADPPSIAADTTTIEPQEPAAQPEPATATVAPGKRTRRTRGEKDKESGSSESSELAHAPKSKKTLIACHFCRARKLRCDGQKPSCANCTKRGNPCTYEQQPKRRGPGKTPRGAGSTKRRGRRAGAGAGGGSGAEAGRSTAGGRAREATGRAEATHTPEIAGPAEAAPAPGPSAAFEPQLTGPVPTYPGFAYRPPSPSSSYPPASVDPISHYAARPGPSRQSESVHSTTSSAPSVPESEESAYTDRDVIDYDELEEFYRQPRPGQPEDPPP